MEPEKTQPGLRPGAPIGSPSSFFIYLSETPHNAAAFTQCDGLRWKPPLLLARTKTISFVLQIFPPIPQAHDPPDLRSTDAFDRRAGFLFCIPPPIKAPNVYLDANSPVFAPTPSAW